MEHRERHVPNRNTGRSAEGDAGARAGESHPCSGTAQAASPKLVRRTFLGDRAAPHATAQTGQVWSIKIHDFGKQWMETSWGKVEAKSGKKGEKGRSRNRERNEVRARGRAKGEIRRKCMAISADHLVTLTYRDNVEDRDRVLHDLERLRRALARAGKKMAFVGVLECQKRGAIHPHLAVRGFQDVRLLRRCWYKIVGNGRGQVNVKGPRPGHSPIKLGRYLSKYISKDFDEMPRSFEQHRYFCSLGVTVPTEKFELVIDRSAAHVAMKMYFLVFQETGRRLGEACRRTEWQGGAGTFGWMGGFVDDL